MAALKMVELNINDTVFFRWRTPGDRARYEAVKRAQWAEIQRQYPKVSCGGESLIRHPDEDGWVSMALHEFMGDVWPLFPVGFQTPIEVNRIRFTPRDIPEAEPHHGGGKD